MFSSHWPVPSHWGKLARQSAWLHYAGLWNGPSYSWPCAEEAPSLFEEQAEPPSLIGRDVKRVNWTKRAAIARGDGRVVCTDHSVGIFGYHSCYYVPYPFWQRQRNHLARWLDKHRGALSPLAFYHRLEGKWYARRNSQRLEHLRQERAKHPPIRIDSRFLTDEERKR